MSKHKLINKVARTSVDAGSNLVRRTGTFVSAGLTWAREIKAVLAADERAEPGAGTADAARSAAAMAVASTPRGEQTDPAAPAPRTKSQSLAEHSSAPERSVKRANQGVNGQAPLHATVPATNAVPGDLRHEVSSLQGPHAIAPSPDAAGEELVDPEAVELPLGSSADDEYGPRLLRSKLPQRDTTGGSLLGVPDVIGTSHEEILDPSLEDFQVTAQPTRKPVMDDDEHYDALDPEATGLEWLARATEAPNLPGEAEIDTIDGMHIDDEVDSPVVSEGSVEASAPADLADYEDESVDVEEELTARGTWGRADPDATEEHGSGRK